MKTHFFATLASLFLAGLSAAQTVEPADAAKVTLSPKSAVVSAKEIALELVIDVEKDCKIEQTLLSGRNLDVYVGNEKRTSMLWAVDGKVSLSAGTRITRTLTVDAGEVITGSEALQTVTFKWPGFELCEAQVRVAPDQSTIDLEKLDYTKTQVTLVTSQGEMRASFFYDKAPKHVEAFVKLCRDGFYEGTKFHRVIRGFMIQGGCPNTKDGATGIPGTGGPGYTLNAEFNDTKHVRGVLSAARLKDHNSAGSQFFVVHGTATHLDNQYSAFGKLESGFETLDTIATTKVRGSTPVEPVVFYAAIVHPVYK